MSATRSDIDPQHVYDAGVERGRHPQRRRIFTKLYRTV